MILIFNQMYVPDPASVGQHVADVAVELARRGHRVRVYTADRGYNDASRRYPPRETIDGVEVRRLALTSLGKRSLWKRAFAAISFATQCTFIALFARGVRGIIFTTSPPLAGAAAAIASALRGLPIVYWLMDLNTDQLVTLGLLDARSSRVKLLEKIHRFILSRCALVITLDRFMRDRVTAKINLDGRLRVIAPWPHERDVTPVVRESNPFRERHGLSEKFVVMHSGNQSPYHPLDTLLSAAVRLRDHPRIRFVLIGDGLARAQIEQTIAQHRLTNLAFLPYQPLSELRYSLSAADLHIVCMGDDMVGLVHPCKVYGAMAVQRPIVFIGPTPSHVAELIERHAIGVHVRHGDVDALVSTIQKLAGADASELRDMGKRGRTALEASYSHALLCGRFCDEAETALGLRATRM